MSGPWEDVLAFWFRELRPAQWFRADPELDAAIRDRFGDLLRSAKAGHLDHWVSDPDGRLALIIILDQFSRNVHRDSAEAFASDPVAQKIVQAGLAAGHDKGMTFSERQFFYMPLMHAEDEALQDLCVQQFQGLLDFARETMDFAKGHRAVIRRFGRFPHRNEALGRASTEEEDAFLSSDRPLFDPSLDPSGGDD